MAKENHYKPTHENLVLHAFGPTMRLLIDIASEKQTITYGAVKKIIEKKAGFSTIFTPEIGWLVGALMDKLWELEPELPILNALVVSRADGTPGQGAGPFLARRFNQKELKDSHSKRNHVQLWRQYSKTAAEEVYRFPRRKWNMLHDKIFGQDMKRRSTAHLSEQLPPGTENDGIRRGRLYGPGGEEAPHKSLRLWVRDNPQSIFRGLANPIAATEVNLASGDLVDVVYTYSDRTIVIEVKSHTSNEADFRRGVFQCIKYRAVQTAMNAPGDSPVEACLVTESRLPNAIAALLEQHGIRHVLAPADRDQR